MDENWGNDLLASRREGISKIRVHATNYSSVVPSHDSVQYSHSMTHGQVAFRSSVCSVADLAGRKLAPLLNRVKFVAEICPSLPFLDYENDVSIQFLSRY